MSDYIDINVTLSLSPSTLASVTLFVSLPTNALMINQSLLLVIDSVKNEIYNSVVWAYKGVCP